MTREEAIQELQNCKGLIQQDGQDYLDERDIPLLDMAIEALSNKPTDEWCSDCKEYDHEKHCCPRFNRVIRTTLNEAVANLKEEFKPAVPNCQKCAIKELWEETEKEDLVSVVRCEDCRWYEPKYKDKEYDCPQGLYAVYENDFCSHGERKEK